MKSYFGEYKNRPGGETVTATVLVFDKKLSIGFRNKDGTE